MNIGTILIATAMMLSFASALFFMRSKRGSKPMQINAARRIFYISSALIVFSVIILLLAILKNDFQYAYVYNNSSVSMHLVYKIAALWAGNEGSYLIWVFILNLMGLFIIFKKNNNDDIILSVTATTQALMLVLLLVKDPFLKIWSVNNMFMPGALPSDGLGMNPLLMNPWMIAHPPVLFLGYASSTIIFAYAINTLIRGEYDGWISAAYRWVLFSMFTLGLGIFMGAYWAYKVLGWGGYWGWDPVENSSLVPWIVCVTLMHSMMLQLRKPVLKKTNIILALSYFILVFYSTFLTRSGVLSEFSVHSFQKSELLLYLGIMLFIITIAALLLFAKRFKTIQSSELKSEMFNLQSMTVFGIIVLLFYSFIVLAGTSMPVISGLIGINPTPVTEIFYNNISIPMGLLLMIFIILSALSSAKYSKAFIGAMAAVSFCLSLLVNLLFEKNMTVFFYIFFAVFLVQITLLDLYIKGKGIILSSRTAHLGIAVMIIGIIISGYYSRSEQIRINTGETVTSGNYLIRLNKYNEKPQSTIGITIEKNNLSRDVTIPYLTDQNLDPVYKEPYVLHEISGDLYIAPQVYFFSAMTYGTEMLHKSEEKEICDMNVRFIGFTKTNMGQPDMTILADLFIDGVMYSPGFRVHNDKIEYLNSKIGNSGRTVSIEKISVEHEVVVVRITPAAGEKVPPDYAVFDISFKQMIWLLWLGTMLVCAGIVLSIIRLRKSSI